MKEQYIYTFIDLLDQSNNLETSNKRLIAKVARFSERKMYRIFKDSDVYCDTKGRFRIERRLKK
jgi:hypothetical protein